MEIWVVMVILLLVLFIGTPVAFGLGFVAVASVLLYLSPSQLTQIGNIAYSQGTNMNQLVAPLFILMAEVLARGGMAADLFSVLSSWLRRLNGGLGISATLACTVFAALCGSSPATAAAIGRISIGEMTRHGYRDDFASGVVAAGGTLGIMIPPSIPLVVYGIMTENSITKLFMAGILPGLVISFLLCVFIFLRARFQPGLVGTYSSPENIGHEADSVSRPHTGGLLKDLKVFVPPFILILIIMGSLYTGLATPTEASGFGAMGAIALVIILGRWAFSSFFESLYATAKTSAMIFFLIFGGMALSYVVSYMGIPHDIANLIVELGVNRWVFILCVYILWFILGCLMDPMSMIVLTIPLLYPTFITLGFDPIWVGIVTTLSVEIGMITPPVGFNLFVLASTTNVPMSRIIRGSIPFLIVLIVALILFTVFPEIVLFLPSRAM